MKTPKFPTTADAATTTQADSPSYSITALQWRHNEHRGVSNHQPHDCLLDRLFKRRSKNTSKLRVNGFCVGNSPVTGEFPAQRASNAQNVSIWWRHHEIVSTTKRNADDRIRCSLCYQYSRKNRGEIVIWFRVLDYDYILNDNLSTLSKFTILELHMISTSWLTN